MPGTDPAAHPAVLFLAEDHTIGPAFGDVCVHGPDLALERHASLQGRYPFVVVAPRLPLKCHWTDPGMPAALAGLLDHVNALVRLDPDRVSVTGIDDGATGAWQLAAALPDRFAALVWVATRPDLGPPGDYAKQMAALPGRLFAAVNNPGRTRQLAADVRRTKRDWRVVNLPATADPLADLSAYTDPATITWLARQRRPHG